MYKRTKSHMFLFIFLISLLFVPIAQADIPPEDKAQIENKVLIIANSISTNNVSSITKHISSAARTNLKTEIENSLSGEMLQFQQAIETYEALGNNQIKVSGRFSANGVGWSITSLSNYYTFERSDEEWLLVDTNFHQKIGSDYIFGYIKNILLMALPFILISGAFWLWMLIDCIKRKFDDKTMWLLLIIFFNLIGAVLYYFTVRKGLIKHKAHEGGQSG